ncbi:hypothetical protein B0H14DRAFT_2593511 [Mycena olivaceomarginata]|nr:hypothetical protein B0H14DRAFT_2593511 [Mycena olivaceomarginata]
MATVPGLPLLSLVSPMLPWAITTYASGESVSVGDVQHAINRALESPMTGEEFDAWIEDQEDRSRTHSVTLPIRKVLASGPKSLDQPMLVYIGLPPVAVTATAVDLTAVFFISKPLTRWDGRRDGRRRYHGLSRNRPGTNGEEHLRNVPIRDEIDGGTVPGAKFSQAKKNGVICRAAMAYNDTVGCVKSDAVFLRIVRRRLARARHLFDGCRRPVATATGGSPKCIHIGLGTPKYTGVPEVDI